MALLSAHSSHSRRKKKLSRSNYSMESSPKVGRKFLYYGFLCRREGLFIFCLFTIIQWLIVILTRIWETRRQGAEKKALIIFCARPNKEVIFAFIFLGDNSEGCLGDNYCPPECTCTGTVVRCSHAKLKEIPNGIPRETSELYLDVNEINAIDTNRLKHLKSLSRLWVVFSIYGYNAGL